MKNEEMSDYAHSLAEMSLENGFDKDAYILKVLSELDMKSNNDIKQEAKTNATIENLSNYMNNYISTDDIQSLHKMMVIMRKLISELYNTAPTQDARDVILHEIQIIQSIR